MFSTTTKLVLGRGRLFFNRFLPGMKQGEGELYLGNTPGFSVSRDVEEIQRVRSYGGQKYSAGAEIVREIMKGRITTDNIDAENYAIWFGGNVVDALFNSSVDIVETMSVRRGRWYQLGMSIHPVGISNIKPNPVFAIGPDVLSIEGNLELDRLAGRFKVMSDAADIVDGDAVTVTFRYHRWATERVSHISSDVEGSLRFVAEQGYGLQTDQFFPHVVLRPMGQIDAKSDNWQEINFEITVRKLNPATDHVYVVQSSRSAAELADFDTYGASKENFLLAEDILNTIINVELPSYMGSA